LGCAIFAGFAIFGHSAPARATISYPVELDVGQMIGAYSFYDNGYTGSRTIVANIEAGLVWSGHPDLATATTDVNGGQYDRHATWVGGILAGEGTGPIDRGIAYGATLWSGAIATSWLLNPGQYSQSFTYNDSSFLLPYQKSLDTGVTTSNGTQTADVINSSWGEGSGFSGNDQMSLTIDALAALSGKTIVFASGDSGPSTNTVGGPFSGQNAIVVGATQFDNANDTYDAVASFSSRSPNTFFLPGNAAGSTGTTISNARALVDLVAPGTNLVTPFYGGATGGFAGNTPASGYYSAGVAGTSVAAPIVSAGAALVVDAGKALYATDPKAIDGRIVKAVLMNSATELSGWNNGQGLNAQGVIVTSQALDYTQGAGQINLSGAYAQYIGGTADLPSRTGGTVSPIGWAYGTITHNPSAEAVDKYQIAAPLQAGAEMKVTLDWFSNQTFTPDSLTSTFGDFDNLNLEVWNESTPTPTLVAESDSLYNSVQFLDFDLPSTGLYSIRVVEDNYVYNYDAGTSTDFGLAWSVPEPTSGSLLLIAGMGLLGRRRRRKCEDFCHR
jgi:hypothetical protein